MRTLVFLPYHGIGHFNACFAMAKILQAEYRIVFAGLGLFRDHVEQQGFNYHSLRTVPFGLGFEHWVNTVEKKKNIYFHSLKDRWTDRVYQLRESDLHDLLEAFNPECILIDYLQSTDVVVMYPEAKKRRIRIGLVQTMLPQRVRKDCPPINSLVLPGDRQGISKARKWFYFVRFLKVSGDGLKFFGRSNSFIVKRRMKLNHMGAEYLSKEAIPYGFHFNHINELILAPREFDFVQNEESSIEHYVGFMPDEERMEEWDENYKAFRIRLKEDPGPLIYCSFGTVKLENSTVVNMFISRLMNVIRKRRCFLIVSVADTLHPSFSHGLPDNVLFLMSAPQLEILSRASLFITHGGLNSIKEAVYAGVPMLVYPLNHKMDQKGNSSRVVFHGLGLRGNLRTDSEAGIEQKIDELLGNAGYKQKLEELKGIDLTYTSEKFRKLFDHLKPLT